MYKAKGQYCPKEADSVTELVNRIILTVYTRTINKSLELFQKGVSCETHRTRLS